MLIETLKNIQSDRKGFKKETYREILKLAKDRVIFYAKGRGSDTDVHFCLYTVPVWLPNRPLYDSTKAANYVVKKMQAEGLNVVKVTPNQLYISWDQQPETKPKTNQSTALLNFL